MLEPIRAILQGSVGEAIKKLDNKFPDENPSIFMPQQQNDLINDKFVFEQLYK